MRSVARRGQDAPPTHLKGQLTVDESQLEAFTRSFYESRHCFVASREDRTLQKGFAIFS